MVLFLPKEHVTKLNKYLTFSGALVIRNHPTFQKTNKKKLKKKSSNFSKIKTLLCNSYARITKMLNVFENSNFLPTKRDKMMILSYSQICQNETIFF